MLIELIGFHELIELIGPWREGFEGERVDEDPEFLLGGGSFHRLRNV